MYEEYYGLREKPFSILPDPDQIYWGPAHRMAFSMLEFGVMNRSQFTVVTGEVGSGKTTLLRYLLRKLDPQKTNVGLITNTPRIREEMLQSIMIPFNLPFEDKSPQALLKIFQDFVCAEYGEGRSTLLILDEAQNLEERALEELRMLSNINVDKFQLLQLMLVGQPQLNGLLAKPQLLQFAQRVSSDFHLKRLAQNEVRRYIDFRLRAVGADRPLFADEACAMIAEASSGTPRMINILCDTALVYGFSSGAERITDKLVKQMLDDKHQFGIFPISELWAKVGESVLG